jgi:hypothetical protein
MSDGDQQTARTGNGYLDAIALLATATVVVLILFISLSDGVDYVHGLGKACLIAHDGWHFHASCSAVTPPTP